LLIMQGERLLSTTQSRSLLCKDLSSCILYK
jgi:hypothetical protein